MSGTRILPSLLLPSFLLAFFVPKSVAFIFMFVILGSQDIVSTTSMTSTLSTTSPRKKDEKDKEKGQEPINNFQHTLHASHWPELSYMTTPSCKRSWKILPQMQSEFSWRKEKDATLGVHSWASYLISPGICILLGKVRRKLSTSQSCSENRSRKCLWDTEHRTRHVACAP